MGDFPIPPGTTTPWNPLNPITGPGDGPKDPKGSPHTPTGAGEFDPGIGWDLSSGPALSRPGSLSSAEIADVVEQLLQERTAVNEDVAKGGIKDNKLKIEQQREIREAKKEEIAEAQKEAADKAAKAGVFGKVFGWIMAIATIIAGIAMIASGAGAVAGAMMIAAGAVQVAQLSVEQAIDDGNLKMSDKDREIFGTVMMAASIVLGVGGGLAAGAGGAIKGAVQAAKEALPRIAARISQEGLAEVAKSALKTAAQSIAKTASSAADDFAATLKSLPDTLKSSGKSFADAAKHPLDTLKSVAKDTVTGIKANPARAVEVGAMTVDAAAGGANQVVQGKLGQEVAVAKKRRDEAEADKEEVVAALARLGLENEELIDALKEALEQYQSGQNDALNILKSDDEVGVNARPILT